MIWGRTHQDYQSCLFSDPVPPVEQSLAPKIGPVWSDPRTGPPQRYKVSFVVPPSCSREEGSQSQKFSETIYLCYFSHCNKILEKKKSNSWVERLPLAYSARVQSIVTETAAQQECEAAAVMALMERDGWHCQLPFSFSCSPGL